MKKSRLIVQLSMALMIIASLFALTPASSASAYSDGPFTPGLGENIPGIGTEPWINPENISAIDANPAEISLYHLHLESNYLRGSQFGFSIPADVVITGIELTINRRSSARNPSIIDNVVSLVIGGDQSENKAMSTTWPLSYQSVTYGSSTDLWGMEWTAEEINSPDFGVILAVLRDNNGNKPRSAYVDFVQVTVYYTLAAEMSVDCGDGTPVTIYGDSIICEATVTANAGNLTPTGMVEWSTDGNGSFDPAVCELAGGDGSATCSTFYSPREVGDRSHMVTASYGGDTNFAPNSAYQAVTVEPRPITVAADPASKTYGSPDPLLTYQVTEGTLVYSDTFTGTLVRDPGEAVGDYAILQGTLALPIDYDLTYEGNMLSINKANPTCLVTGYETVYDGESHSAMGACTGVFGEPLDTLDLSATQHLDAGVYADVWTFTDLSGNYNDASETVTDTITPVSITVVADPQEKVYGDADPVLTYQVTEGTLVPGDTFTGSLDRETGENVGTYAIQQGSLTLSSNYILTFQADVLTITARQVTIAADPQEKVYGDADPVLTYQVTEGTLVPGDAFTGSLEREAGQDVGSYGILQGTLALSQNYILSFQGDVLTITVRPITVTADAQSKYIGMPDPVLTFQVTAGSLVYEDAFTGSLDRQPGESKGSYVILQGTLALSANYELTFVSNDLTILGARIWLPFINK